MRCAWTKPEQKCTPPGRQGVSGHGAGNRCPSSTSRMILAAYERLARCFGGPDPTPSTRGAGLALSSGQPAAVLLGQRRTGLGEPEREGQRVTRDLLLGQRPQRLVAVA